MGKCPLGLAKYMQQVNQGEQKKKPKIEIGREKPLSVGHVGMKKMPFRCDKSVHGERLPLISGGKAMPSRPAITQPCERPKC